MHFILLNQNEDSNETSATHQPSMVNTNGNDSSSQVDLHVSTADIDDIN